MCSLYLTGSIPVYDEARLGGGDVLAVRGDDGVGDDGAEGGVGQLEVELAGQQVPDPDAVARHRHRHPAPLWCETEGHLQDSYILRSALFPLGNLSV